MENNQNQNQRKTSTLEYSIVDHAANAPMKSIPLHNIPTFHGLTTEYPNAFLFEFDVLCRGYDYTTDPQKLKLFPSTLKGTTLCWFMGLVGEPSIIGTKSRTFFLKNIKTIAKPET